MVCETGLFILVGLLLESTLQHFDRESVAIGMGICVADANVQGSTLGALPEVMHEDASLYFISPGSGRRVM